MNWRKNLDLIKLKKFVENIDTTQSILVNKDPLNHCLCRHFLYECIDIYIRTNKTYCPSQGDENKNSCDTLKRFLDTYTSFLRNEPQMSDEIASSHFSKKNYLTECAPKEESEAFFPVGPMLRSQLQSWNRKNHILDEKQEFLFYGTVDNNAYSKDTEYHIQYHLL
ncbi:PIR Superfamily Protein [Plasmodium ovale wallikeri]|uniref:PIR Superfamily Protein n=1 Tax=Plasmodium ovale wallikeri TaxID=864142 RepID=A0A1A9APJ0_PLAOA|nr:PIR Superfamily Protein [Plasmodium ovale wallikeri]SBT59573.1 PIR Superfamily Protein [Plasmodium ovale wallikeri]